MHNRQWSAGSVAPPPGPARLAPALSGDLVAHVGGGPVEVAVAGLAAIGVVPVQPVVGPHAALAELPVDVVLAEASPRSVVAAAALGLDPAGVAALAL